MVCMTFTDWFRGRTSVWFVLLLKLILYIQMHINLIDLLCLMPLSAIFQLYHGDQF